MLSSTGYHSQVQTVSLCCCCRNWGNSLLSSSIVETFVSVLNFHSSVSLFEICFQCRWWATSLSPRFYIKSTGRQHPHQVFSASKESPKKLALRVFTTSISSIYFTLCCFFSLPTHRRLRLESFVEQKTPEIDWMKAAAMVKNLRDSTTFDSITQWHLITSAVSVRVDWICVNFGEREREKVLNLA